MCPYISFQRPGWLLQLSLSTCNKSRWVSCPPITTTLLTSTDPDTNTHIKKTECGGKIGQRLLLPFSISWAVAKALIWTGWVAFPWFSSILYLSLIQEFWIQVGRRLRPTWPCRCHATNHIHLEQRWIWFRYSIPLNHFQLDIARIMRILLIVHINVFGLEWVKRGIKWILQEKAGPPYPALRPFMETKPFLSRFHKSISQPPPKILSTCQSCRYMRPSKTKSQESQAVRNYVLSLKNSTVAYLAYHRYNLYLFEIFLSCLLYHLYP